MVKQTIRFFVIIFFLQTLLSCELTNKERYQERYFVTGLLKSNSFVNPNNPIALIKSVPVENASLKEVCITGAEIKLFDLTEGTYTFLTEHVINPEINFIVYIDTNNQIPILEKHHYRIEVTIPNYQHLITAETIIPNTIDFVENDAFTKIDPGYTGTYPELPYDEANSEYPLKIRFSNEEKQALMFSYYCREEFEDAYYTIDFPGLGEQPEDPDDYENPSDGSPRNIEFYYEYEPNYENDGYYYVTDRSYTGNIFFYGRYEITIYAIDENYYKYNYKYEGYKHGGITNAYGYFGSASGEKIFTKVIE